MKRAVVFSVGILIFMFFVRAQQAGKYVCMPCGNECDKATYDKPGECSQCHMKLVEKSTVMFKSIQPSAICSYILKNPGVVLLDVRTREEFEGKADDYGTLKNAINIPVQELESRIGELKKYKDKEVIVYCSHSRRSPRAGYFLMQNGFTNVTNMEGGMSVMTDNNCKK